MAQQITLTRMNRIRVFAVALLLAVTSAALAQDYSSQIRVFEQFAEEQMKKQKMPGLSVAVRYGDFYWSRGFGFADVENQVAARPETSYRMASVTKPMTAIAVLKLAGEGKIDLDAEVQKYVPHFPRKPHAVTVRQLLSHLGGISHYRDYSKEGRIREPKSTREALAIFQDFDLVAEPGTTYRYSSYGYNLLGAVIEGASGTPYGKYMTENVWKPLGMTSTVMDDPRALIPHRATGYTLEDGQLRRSEYVDISSRFAAGGTRSTVGDMIRLVEGLAAGKVLKPESRDLAWTAAKMRDGRYAPYGFGFVIAALNGRHVVLHGGSQQETRTTVLLMPRERFAIALASNFEDADLDGFEEKLITLFVGDPRPVSARTNSEDTSAIWSALDDAFNHGLAYYERHGKPMTTDARELARAFRWLRDALGTPKKLEDGRHPVAGEPLTKIGSYMAGVLDARGDLDVYHREGALRFFADYHAAARTHRLDKSLARRVKTWLAQWPGVWTPELQSLDLSTPAGLDVLEKHRAALAAAELKPDFAGPILQLAENHARRGDIATALRAARIGLDIHPRSAGMNGMLGILMILSGDVPRGRELLTTSVQINPNGYANPDNLVSIADFLARGPSKPAAIALLEIASELHPNAEKVKTRLAELKK